MPGEIGGAIEDRTDEKNTLNRQSPTPAGYKQLLHQQGLSTWLGPTESTALLGTAKKPRIPAVVERRVNLLYIPMMTDGYVVVFDVQSSDSLAKARTIVKHIGANQGKANGKTPILLLGNKTDTVRSSSDVVRKAGDFARSMSKSATVMFAHGSALTNTFELDGEGMDVYNLFHEFVMALNKAKRGVSKAGYDSQFVLGKRSGKKRRGGAGLAGAGADGGGCCGWQCCRCLGSGDGEDGDLDEELGGVAADGEDEDGGGCVVM